MSPNIFPGNKYSPQKYGARISVVSRLVCVYLNIIAFLNHKLESNWLAATVSMCKDLHYSGGKQSCLYTVAGRYNKSLKLFKLFFLKRMGKFVALQKNILLYLSILAGISIYYCTKIGFKILVLLILH